MRIILSSRNPSKVAQIAAMFKSAGITVVSLDEAGIAGEAVEDGKTLTENSYKKAQYAWSRVYGSWVMSEDTGLFIDALRGAPGIRAARWAGEDATTKQITDHTLLQLKDVAMEYRGASFKTVATLIDPHGQLYTFSGELPGRILMSERVPPQPKMPYSGIFEPMEHRLVLAEMSIDDENKISHRGQAFHKMLEFLKTIQH